MRYISNKHQLTPFISLATISCRKRQQIHLTIIRLFRTGDDAALLPGGDKKSITAAKRCGGHGADSPRTPRLSKKLEDNLLFLFML